ncbi:MAG: hypothetical protein GYA21_08360 [Myxococcales bacterium]|nr:hypothetical protein [Myxococcales bacterium]
MNEILWIGVGVAAFVALGWAVLLPSISKEVARYQRTGDVAPLLARIRSRRPAARPAAFDLAIKTMWNAYQRELCPPLIRELAKDHTREPVAQYWLSQLMQVEPKMAREHLDQNFVSRFFLPDLAARCGRAG